MNSTNAEIEEALRISEEKYRTLTENIAVGLFRSTPGPKGKFMEVNPAFVKMLGYPDKDSLLRINVSDIYKNPKDRSKLSKKISGQGFVRNEELRLMKTDGTPIIVSETAIAVKDKTGKIIYFDGIIEDITERKQAQEALLIQKTYLEELFNSAAEAIILHDNKDVVVNVNEEFCRMFGYTRDETIGKQINDLVAPESFKKEAEGFSQNVLNGRRIMAESVRRRKDGSLIDVSILGAPIFHEKKQMGVYAIYRDITERKKAEEASLLQKTYLERLFNSAPEAIVLHNNDDRIANVNEEFTRMFGYTAEEAIGKPINDLLANDELQEEARRVSETVMRGEIVEMETKRKHKDGSLIEVSILGAPIIHEGKQIGDYAIYRDITERKKAEDEVRRQKSYLERLFNSAPEAIVLHDVDDRVLNVNTEFTRLFGYTLEEAIGKPINDLVAPEDLKKEAAGYSSMVIHGERVEAESKRRTKDGRLIDVSIMGAPIMHGGEQIGVYAIYRDITERKKAQETRVRLDEERRMARNIQLNFLPKVNPKLPRYTITGKSIPAMNVGGDYYDFIPIDNDHLVICIGDVSGNGLAASLVMANLQATIRGQVAIQPDPGQCLERSNRLLYESTDARMFISLFYAILDIPANRLEYANAGQDLPLLFSVNQKTKVLSERGMALGMVPDATYHKSEFHIHPGDLILFYTDGICESMNARHVQFGETRLKRIIRKHVRLHPQKLLELVFAQVQHFCRSAEQGDDMTAVVLKRDY